MIDHICITNLPIIKREREGSSPVLEKFKTNDGTRKYRITDMGEYFWFEYTNPNCRYFVHKITFKSLEDARNFIFTSEAP